MACDIVVQLTLTLQKIQKTAQACQLPRQCCMSDSLAMQGAEKGADQRYINLGWNERLRRITGGAGEADELG
jgi:hypothetical protein